MERWSGRVAVVTGASSGIGADITRALVKHGMKVVGCARNVARVQTIADELKDERGLLKAVKCDLEKEEDILAMFQMIKSDPDLGGVDVCVNNAGLAHDHSLLDGKTEDWRQMLNVNVLALCICTREAFKSMQERGVNDGHFILLNSLSGHRVKPDNNTHFYTATKYAVTAILHGLRYEFREAKVNTKVTSISPGFVETEFLNRMFKDDEKAREISSMFKFLQPSDIVDSVIYALSSAPRTQFLQPSDIVDSVIYALSSAPRTQIDDILLRSIDEVN